MPLAQHLLVRFEADDCQELRAFGGSEEERRCFPEAADTGDEGAQFGQEAVRALQGAFLRDGIFLAVGG